MMINRDWILKTIAAASGVVGEQQHPRHLKWLQGSLRAVTIIMGGLYAWAAAISHSMNADGINYLDMGDALIQGDWQIAINSVWSPMYALILGLSIRILDPPIQWEFPTVHLANLLIFLLALVCFEFFWRQIMTVQQLRISTGSAAANVPRHNIKAAQGQSGLSEMQALPGHSQVGLPDWILLPLGYLLFLITSLILITVWAVTPDMLMSAFVYLAAGVVIQIQLGIAGWRHFVVLGVILGLSYLAKAIMLPVSMLLLGVVLLSAGNVRKAAPRVMLSLSILIAIVLPYVAVISSSKGRLTIGEAGTFTYAKHVNGVPFQHWQGDRLGNGTPIHPTRQIFDSPPIYEFGTPIGGTYPVGYDPSYWYEGLELNFNWGRQIRAIIASSLFYFELFSYQYGMMTFGLIVLYAMMYQGGDNKLTNITRHWGLALVALAMFVFYGVVAVIGRYIGVFMLLLWANLLAELRPSHKDGNRRLITVTSWLMISFLSFNIVAFSLSGYSDLAHNRQVNAETQPPSWPGAVAEELWRLGIAPGDQVAVIGYAFDSYWARLARVKIVAETLGWQADSFWLGDPAFQQEVLAVYASTGAKAIVAEYVPTYAEVSDWHQVGNSNFYVYVLRDATR
jgi:hypothetical protein